MKPLRLLLVEDKAHETERIVQELRRAGFAPSWYQVQSATEFIKQIDLGPDVILADESVKQFDSFRALQVMHAKRLSIPFIVVGDERDEKNGLQCVRCGADRYLSRNHYDDLGNVIRQTIDQKRLNSKSIGEQRRVNELERTLFHAYSAQAAAESANRMKDEFLATLSHELRTPMNAILGWTELLRSHQVSPEEMEEVLQAIYRNAKIQMHLINDLLDSSSLLNGTLQLYRMPTDLKKVVYAAADLLESTIAAKHLSFEICVDDEVKMVLADAERLQQVLWNLLSNAIKFSRIGGSVRVEICAAKDEEGAMQVAVTDDGQGIDSDFLPYVFERFRQEDGSITRLHGGLGLGLALARQIVELHGGRIAASSPGRGLGATFVVSLPSVNVN